MSGSNFGAAVGGFLVGVVVAIATAYAISPAKPKLKRPPQLRRRLLDEDDDHDDVKSISVPRGLKRSVLVSTQGGFLTEIVAQLWSYINVAGSEMVREMVEPMFQDMLPGPLSSLHFTKIDLGKVPIHFDNVVVHELKNGVVKFDMDIKWDGECDIDLYADYIGGFGVESVKLHGRMTIVLKPLTNHLPVVSAIQYAFINPPHLELNFTGLAKVADFAIISSTMRKIIQDVLASMIVLPNRMLYKMDLAKSFFKTYQPPLGIARITLLHGKGFQVEKLAFGKDIPDVYCNIECGASPQVWRTSTIQDDLSPEWNESKDFVLCDRAQTLRIHAWDQDRAPLDADDDLGSAEIAVGDILLEGGTVHLPLENDDEQATGAVLTVRCELLKLIPDLKSLQSPATAKNTLCGVLTILVTRAFDLPIMRAEANSFVKVTYGSDKFFTGAVTDYPGIDVLNPFYDCAFQIPLTPERMNETGSMDDVVFYLMNGATILGTASVTFAALSETVSKTITQKCKIGDQGAALEFCVTLSGVEVLEQSVEAEEETSPPTKTKRLRGILGARRSKGDTARSVPNDTNAAGTILVTAVNGYGFQIQKNAGFRRKPDIPDVYCKVKFGSKTWKTSVVKNNVSPEWNESSKFSLSTSDDIIKIDVYDRDSGIVDTDDYLGSAKIELSELLEADDKVDLQLKKKGKPTGAFVAFRCEMADS